MKKYSIPHSFIRHLIFATILFCNISGLSQNLYEISYEYTDARNNTLESKLVIDGSHSVFKVFDNRKEGWVYEEDGSIKEYLYNDNGLSNFFYSNEDYSFARITYPKFQGGTIYKYKEGNLNWELTGNIKKIANYNCQEALLNFHGRKYQVWFTAEISIYKGPLKLHGLPGLVVEVKEENNFCKIKLLDIKRNNKNDLMVSIRNFFDKNNALTYEEYQKRIKKNAIRAKVKIASYKAETIKEYGGELEYNFDNGDYFFVSNVVDIPKGTIKELGKISL